MTVVFIRTTDLGVLSKHKIRDDSLQQLIKYQILYDSARDILVIKDPIVYDVLCQQTEDNEN